ncbi:hypothetical protein [Cupriavidus necator]|uniref:hypothetical protein n=1 Tax=Cupriavidus necator TaxID=106590 RepID=UPI0005B437CC|nr:hypothetical protein [Cupriavidus necator]
MSKALDILLALKERLQSIRTADGYATDIGARVYLGREFGNDEQDPVPLSSLHDGSGESKDATRPHAGTNTWARSFVIEGFDTCDPDNPLIKAHAMIADIKRAVFKDGGLDGRVMNLRIVGDRAMPRGAGTKTVCAQVLGVVEYLEKPTAP